MQSLFKFHIALAVLSEIDKGKILLDQKIEIGKHDLLPEDFWSPLRDENPKVEVLLFKDQLHFPA